jgi:hypothetical protein
VSEMVAAEMPHADHTATDPGTLLLLFRGQVCVSVLKKWLVNVDLR